MRLLKYWLESLIVLSFATVVIVTFLQVLFRFVFQYPAYWTTDVITISFIWFIFLGSALAMKKNEHISVDIFSLPERMEKIISIVGNLFIILFLICLSYFGYQHAINSMNQIIPSINIPRGYVYLIVPFSSLLMIYYMCKRYLAK